MLGGLSNWISTIKTLADHGYRAVAPELPVYGLPLESTTVAGLTDHVARFLHMEQIRLPVLVGNSLGGHVALMHTLEGPQRVSGLVLTGASGIHEVILGDSKLKRFDREYVRNKAALTFYDPIHVTDELLDEVLSLVCDRQSAVRLIRMARSAKTDTLRERLGEIKIPSLLIWGRHDRLTPPEVALDFQQRLGNAELEFVDRCGHAPMIERPVRFGRLLLRFLSKLDARGTGARNKASQSAIG
jgi:pimeloyl-ACP methyl ester carboxylesterase